MSLVEPLPVRRVRYRTRDVDEATAMLRTRYVHYEPSFTGDVRRFLVEIDSHEVSTSIGWLRIDHTLHMVGLDAAAEPFTTPTVTVARSGRMHCTCRREEVTGVRLGPMAAPSRFEFEGGVLAVASVDLEGLRRVGAEISGLAPTAIVFGRMRPISPQLGCYVAATIDHLKRNLLDNDEAMSSVLLHGQAFRVLATAVLATFPNTTHTLDPVREPVSAEPATVRRAVEFIDANAHRNIGPTEIAEAARLGVRALQMAFRRHHDTTPMAYLKRVRLERTHRDLKAADPTTGDTVAAIAARWGFARASAFSTDYRRSYGCTPGKTLRG